MSKTWKQQPKGKRPASQKDIDRMRDAEAKEEIREALQRTQEVSHVS